MCWRTHIIDWMAALSGFVKETFQVVFYYAGYHVITTAISYAVADNEGGKLWNIPFCRSSGPSVNAKQLINDT